MPTGREDTAPSAWRAAASSWSGVVVAPLATGLLYFLAAKLGAWLAFPSAPVSAFWAPNAILLAALVLVPRQRWSLCLLAILPFHLLAQLGEYPLPQVLIQYLLNVAEALIGAFAIVMFCPQPLRYDRVRTAFVLIAFGGIIAPLLTSLLMAGAFVGVGLSDDFWLTLIARTITNTFAVVALVPLLVHGVERLRTKRREIALERALEACALAICLTAVGFWVFVLPAEGANGAPALLYAPLPILAWAAVRFGVPGACGAALLVGALSTWGVLNGHGPFTAQLPVQNALSVVSFQVVTCIVLVAFAALLEEWRVGARALSASEARFRSIFENNIIPTVLWREDSRVSEVNDAFLRLTGFSKADIDNGCLRIDELTAGAPGSRVSVLHPDPLQRFEATEKELTLRDGRRIPVILGQCRFSSGDPGGVLYALDLSAFRRAEAQRLTAENLHSAVLASVHDQIAVLDSNGTIIEINDSWRRYVQTAPSPRFDRVLAGENFLTACARAAERGDQAAADQLNAVRAVLDGAEVRRQLRFSATSADEQSWFEVSVERLRRHEGGAVITRTDVTARKRAELEARNQRQQLAHLGRAAVLGQLSGAFAHELNQPLTSILGNAEAALRLLEHGTHDPAEMAAILRDIVEDDERAAQVIQGLRALLDKGETRRHAVDLNVVVREVLDLAGSELITRNVLVSTELDGAAPPVMADHIQMQQVVLNLLMNAGEAMAGMPVADRRVAVRTRFDRDNAAVEVTVTDSGCGIARGDVERIFQPFVTTKAHGMGLGLAICRSVAESHRGRLWAENGAKRGAVFHLIVPVEGGLP